MGIDSGSRVIDEAIKRNTLPGVTYAVFDLNRYHYPPETYDCVISNLVLHYIEDLGEIYRKVHQTLAPGGYFILNIESRFYCRCPSGDDYLIPGARETVFVGKNVVKQHHTLTQILMGLLHAGFCLEAVEELRR